jgi:hypothetical protein
MIMDHYRDRWAPLIPQVPVQPWPLVNPQIVPLVSPVSPAEVAEFRRLLERAREYDKRTHQADCELDEKRAVLKKLADALGIDISFIDPPTDEPTSEPVAIR